MPETWHLYLWSPSPAVYFPLYHKLSSGFEYLPRTFWIWAQRRNNLIWLYRWLKLHVLSHPRAPELRLEIHPCIKGKLAWQELVFCCPWPAALWPCDNLTKNIDNVHTGRFIIHAIWFITHRESTKHDCVYLQCYSLCLPWRRGCTQWRGELQKLGTCCWWTWCPLCKGMFPAEGRKQRLMRGVLKIDTPMFYYTNLIFCFML